MPRPLPWPPKVYPRKDGTCVVRIYSAPRTYNDITLGPIGSEEARAEYARIVAECEVAGRASVVGRGRDLTVTEICVEYMRWAKDYYDYRQVHKIGTALRVLRSLYGHTSAAAFGPNAFRAVQDAFVSRGWSRRYCNQLGGCIRQTWKWAASRELLPATVATALFDVCGDLRRNKTTAPESDPIRPVAQSVVDSTLPHLPPIVADMVRVQLATGMRPGEVCALRPCDIDRNWRMIDGVGIWLYRLDRHKTDWRGHRRWVPIGPRAQVILGPYLDRDPAAYCFSPREVRDWWRAARAAHYAALRGGKPRSCDTSPTVPAGAGKRQPRAGYDTQTYGRCIRRACELHGVEFWAPNQLRHAVLTDVETEYSREDARCVGGHRNASTTAIYAESVERAAKVIAKIG